MVLLWLVLGTAGDIGFLVSAMALLVLPDLESGMVNTAAALQGVHVDVRIHPDTGRWILTLSVSMLAIAVACLQLRRGQWDERRESSEGGSDRGLENDDLLRAA